MKDLTIKEKREIFWALLEKYPTYQRGRIQAKNIFRKQPQRLKKALKEIAEQESASYKLLKKFADEVLIELPAYECHSSGWVGGYDGGVVAKHIKK
jgi:hypothetical protein